MHVYIHMAELAAFDTPLRGYNGLADANEIAGRLWEMWDLYSNVYADTPSRTERRVLAHKALGIKLPFGHVLSALTVGDLIEWYSELQEIENGVGTGENEDILPSVGRSNKSKSVRLRRSPTRMMISEHIIPDASVHSFADELIVPLLVRRFLKAFQNN